MRDLETYAGSAVWMAVALLMAGAALEPVEPGSARADAPAYAVSLCADGTANLAMGCESIHL
jgi:hypothetical protein